MTPDPNPAEVKAVSAAIAIRMGLGGGTTDNLAWVAISALDAHRATRSEAEVKAEALREAADILTVKSVDPAYEGQVNDCEFGSGFYQGIRSSRRALRDRAARIEAGDE